jgi:hypothetical protein
MTELFPTSPLYVWECTKCGIKGDCYDGNARLCPQCTGVVYPHPIKMGSPEDDQHPYRRD